MKTMSMTALFLILGTSPAGAGIFTVQDQEGQCVASEAMLIGKVTESTVLFPNELGACYELEVEIRNKSAAGLIQHDKIARPISVEPAVEIASRVGSAND